GSTLRGVARSGETPTGGVVSRPPSTGNIRLAPPGPKLLAPRSDSPPGPKKLRAREKRRWPVWVALAAGTPLGVLSLGLLAFFMRGQSPTSTQVASRSSTSTPTHMDWKTAPLVSGPPKQVMLIRCGRGSAKEQEEVRKEGYGYKLLQGGHYN